MSKEDKMDRYPIAILPGDEDTEEFKTLMTLPKKDLVRIIQQKNDLLLQYVDQVNKLKLKGRA